MKRTQSFRRLLACLLCAALWAALTGCGASGGAGGLEDGRVPDSGISVKTAAEPSGGDGPALPTDAENNGGDYVRVDRKVYFREYGPGALGKLSYFGEFTTVWNFAGGESRILSYDLDTGEVREALTDAGYGPLYYGDGGFYLQERAGVRDRVVWHSLDGTHAEPLCNGTILDITPGGLLAVRWDSAPADGDGPDQFRLYRNTALAASMDMAGNETFIGLTEDGLFYMQEISVETEAETETNWMERRTARTIWQLQTDGTQVQFGALPEQEDDSILSAEIDGFAPARDCVGIDVGFYAGTGHFLQAGVSVSVIPGQADSLTVLEVPAEYQEEELGEGEDPQFRLAVDPEGKLVFVHHLLDEVRTNWTTGDLERYDGENWRTLLPGFAGQQETGSGFRKIVQSAAWVDGAAYVTLACAMDTPAANLGWREAYTLLHMLHLRVAGDGSAEERAIELASVNHEALLGGMVWFLEGEDALLFRGLGEEDNWNGTDDWNELSAVYRIPIAPDAVWDGGRDAILSHAPRASLTELDEASYYGYPIPETGTEELLYLRLDREGRAVYLTETAPDALLSIQMGMPESELDEAAEVVNVQRRDSDEDTPWYWAKLTALQDGVDLRLERTPDADTEHGMEYYAIMEGAFVPGTTIAHRVLNKGEYVAVRASLPWYPETRVSVGKDGTWGAYVFGEDNYLHLENEDGSIPEKTVAGFPQPDTDAYGGLPETLLYGGDWYYYAEGDRQTALAAVSFSVPGEEASSQRYSGYGDLDVTAAASDEDRDIHRLYARWDRLYTGDYGVPDLLCFYTMESPLDEEGKPASAGDYRVDIYRTDGLELLHLIQGNNGDGILSRLIPGGENRTSFTFVRWRGVTEPGAKLRNVTCPAVVVREVPDGIGVWLKEAEQVDEWEDGSPVYAPIPGAPCLPYVYGMGVEVPEGEVKLCMVSIDQDGVVQEIKEIR